MRKKFSAYYHILGKINHVRHSVHTGRDAEDRNISHNV